MQTCLVGSGADGKHNALEAVTVVLDLPPPQPLQMVGGRATDRADPKSAIALQRLVQAAVRVSLSELTGSGYLSLNVLVIEEANRVNVFCGAPLFILNKFYEM